MTANISIRKIVLLADGTGNSRRAQFRTNVWKLYDALDLSPGSNQVAFYHDGVGTSNVAPVKLIGNVFGFGVARNLRNLYAFLCRNYEEGATIHVFGFSRGAFTARVLAGMIAREGVRALQDEAEIDRWSREALSSYRRYSNSRQYGPIRRTLVRGVRAVKDLFRRTRSWADEPVKPDIRFLGVWDTVSAYGGPVLEMVRGWSEWVWPLSFGDYKLSPKVACARHALALDEEREAFQPLLWDEFESHRPGRIRQVWFAGVHSDVGGGYPDQGLSDVALRWMLDEARDPANGGLDFHAASLHAIRRGANACAPAHDSRSGVGVAYRYQPRRIDAFTGVANGSPARDPDTGTGAMLRTAVLHASALHRIQHRVYGYAPIALPQDFEDSDGGAHRLDATLQKRIWRLVLGRRRRQFMLLFTLAAMALTPAFPRAPWVSDAGDALRPFVHALLASIPGLPNFIADAYAPQGGWLVVLGVVLLFWRHAGDRQRDRIVAVARRMWGVDRTNGASVVGITPFQARLDALYRFTAPVRWPINRFLRWRVAPTLFGVAYWALPVWCLGACASQLWLLFKDPCYAASATTTRSSSFFRTSDPCAALGVALIADQPYRIRVTADGTWGDQGVQTTPMGFSYLQSLAQSRGVRDVGGATIAHLFGIALRRRVDAAWFAPVLAVVPKVRTKSHPDGQNGWLKTLPLPMRAGPPNVYEASFVAPATGPAYLYVNDASGHYANKHGSARVELFPSRWIGGPLASPRPATPSR